MVKCSSCPAKFDSGEELADHLQDAHSIEFFGLTVLQRFRLKRHLHISEGCVVFESGVHKDEVVVKIARSHHGQQELDNEHLLLSEDLKGCLGVPVILAYASLVPGGQCAQKILVTSPLGKPIKLCFDDNKNERSILAERLSRQLCDILRSVHTCGVLHRDIKPDNLMGSFTSPEDLTLIDFGSAIRISQVASAEPFGTPHYLAECFRETGLASYRGDFESAAWSMHALEVGWREYEKEDPQSKLDSRPPIEEVAQCSLAVSTLMCAAPRSDQRPRRMGLMIWCVASLFIALTLSTFRGIGTT